MEDQKVSACKLHKLRISIKPIRHNGEANGFAVVVAHGGAVAKWIYRFPIDRAEVLNAVLTRIESDLNGSYPYSRRRQGN